MDLSTALTGKTDNLTSQFLRYFMVGGVAFAVDFSALFLLTEFGRLHYLVSASASFMAGIAVNYGLSITWVFDHRRLANRMHEFAIFAVVGIIGLALNTGLMWSFTELLGFHYLHSKGVAAVAIFMFNFGARKTLLFSGRSQANEGITTEN